MGNGINKVGRCVVFRTLQTSFPHFFVVSLQVLPNLYLGNFKGEFLSSCELISFQGKVVECVSGVCVVNCSTELSFYRQARAGC